jgi:hypothetical protein
MLWALCVFLGLSVIRVVVKITLIFARRKGYNQRHAVIVGAGRAITSAMLSLLEQGW